jgi:diguanylate cyclase (GGDEF)-like protein/PAS domain S-box-containing protein
MQHRALSVAVLAVGAACAAVFLAAPPDSGGQMAALLTPLALTAVLLGARVRASDASVGAPLRILLAGYLLYAGALLVWYLAPVGFGYRLPFPSPLDAVFFTSYVVFAVFLLAVLRRQVRHDAVASRVALADALILTTSASAVLWVTVIEPHLTNGTPALPTAVAVLYPAFVLLLFALAARLAASGGFVRSAPGLLLLLWIGAALVADTIYGFQSAGGRFAYISPVTVAWIVSYAALGALAVHPGFVALLCPGSDEPSRGASARAGRAPSGARPAVLLVAALVPLALAAWRPDCLLPLLAVSAVTFALVTYRASIIAGDLGEQRRLAHRLEQAVIEVSAQRDELARLAAAVSSTDDAVITCSPAGVITGWNAGAERLYGYAEAEAIGVHVSMLRPPESHGLSASASAALAERRSVRMERIDVRKDGSRVPTSVTVSNIYDEAGRITGAVGICRDVSDRNRAEEQAREAARQLEVQADELTRLAFHDPLTGLGNRALFRERLADMLAAPGGGTACALIVLDLDDFKVVNDSLGHPIGDALLVAAAQRLRRLVGDEGIVTRLGGDEFAVLLPAGEADAVAVGERILSEFYRDFLVLGHALRTTASVGIAVPGAGATAADLLRSGDLAMYAAKVAGKGKLAVYRPEMLVQAQQRLDLENHLRHALQREEMHLVYQPIVDADTGDVRAVEALLRWQHPAWGAVSPATFIPVAEMSGSIVSLGRWVLRTACRDVRALGAQHGRPVGVCVNVSVRQLQAADFVAVVAAALEESGLEPALLTLEVTESLLMEEDVRCIAVLRALHALGVHLSIDDFGTGHSSLARLRTLPVTEIKIDRAFVSEIGVNGDCGPIVTAVVAMARALGLSIVAEGVETHAQLLALQRLGCNAIQGYLVSRPLPLADLRLAPAEVMVTASRDAEQSLIALVTRLRAHAPSAGDMSEPVAALVREALAELVAATGLDTVYLTRVDLDAQVQQVLLTHSAGPELVPEGLVVDWAETVCKRAVDVGPTYTTDAPGCFPDSAAARDLGIMTYVVAPIRCSGGELIGTLCGAAAQPRELSADTRALIDVFAHLLGPRLATASPTRAPAAAGIPLRQGQELG